MDAPVSCRQLVPSKTSGTVTDTPASSLPAIVSISPLGRTVFVGYQRPCVIGGPLVQEALTGSNTVEFGRPLPSSMCPPATSSRPSGRKSCPAQNSHAGLGAAVKAPVAGSQICGSPLRPQPSTLPSASRWRWSCTTGASNTADQWPICEPTRSDTKSSAAAGSTCGDVDRLSPQPCSSNTRPTAPTVASKAVDRKDLVAIADLGGKSRTNHRVRESQRLQAFTSDAQRRPARSLWHVRNGTASLGVATVRHSTANRRGLGDRRNKLTVAAAL